MVSIGKTRNDQVTLMSRFESLEFDDAKGSGKTESRGEAIRDDTYFCRKAVTAWLGADFELALRDYSRAAEKNSACFEAWIGQIRMLIEFGEYPEAIIWSDKALELFPEHPELFATKAIAYSRDSKVNKALAFSDNSVTKNNTTSLVWLARAEVLMKGKSRIAENCISKAVSVAGNKKNIVHLQAGRLLRRFKKYPSALEHLSNSVRDFPKSPLAWFEQGCCQARLGFSEAEVSLQESLDLRPLWAKAQTELEKVKGRGSLGRLLRNIFRR